MKFNSIHPILTLYMILVAISKDLPTYAPTTKHEQYSKRILGMPTGTTPTSGGQHDNSGNGANQPSSFSYPTISIIPPLVQPAALPTPQIVTTTKPTGKPSCYPSIKPSHQPTLIDKNDEPSNDDYIEEEKETTAPTGTPTTIYSYEGIIEENDNIKWTPGMIAMLCIVIVAGSFGVASFLYYVYQTIQYKSYSGSVIINEKKPLMERIKTRTAISTSIGIQY